MATRTGLLLGRPDDPRELMDPMGWGIAAEVARRARAGREEAGKLRCPGCAGVGGLGVPLPGTGGRAAVLGICRACRGAGYFRRRSE